jgi:peptidoglycan hydrolase-like protein with peptidoglycan-binding domain
MRADPRGARRRLRRRAGLAGAPLIVAATAAGIIVGLRDQRPAASANTVPVAAAPVVRTDITNTQQVNGSLSYSGSYTLINETLGTAYTWLPQAGAAIRRGQRLYEVDGASVVLFYGARPEWRALSAGVTPGADVRQLDANLIALGYGVGLTVSDYFTPATAHAVATWQTAAGLPVTGTVPLGEVSYAPGPLRITGATPTLGSPPQPGTTVLTATSPVPVVVAALPVDQEYLVKAGDRVTVTLPDGATTTPGVITSVSSVATQGSGGSGGQAGGGSANPASGSSAAPGGGTAPSPATVQMTVRLIHPGAAGNLDQAPVTVNVVSAQARNALAVPINALVALAGGGYAVEMVDGAARHLVAVQPGLFSDTLVQVTAPGLAAGMKVEVPSP